MKIIMCGPPHSGKSVLISTLYRFMPSDSFQRIIANGDGEGLWSNNPDQKQVQDVRIKSDNSKEEFEMWAATIRTAVQDIVLVDIGGRLSEDKAPLFDAADSFIVLSSNPSIIEDWVRFGEDHGCRCIAKIESRLEGEDELIATSPCFEAVLSHLERGQSKMGSPVIQKLADLIVSQSGYMERQHIDFYKEAERLGDEKQWITSEGITVRSDFFTLKNAPRLYERASEFQGRYKYEVIGANANWVASVVGLHLISIKGSRLFFYDNWTNGYIEARPIEKCEKSCSNDLAWCIQETDDSVYIKFYLPNYYLDSRNISSYSIPVVDETKKLYISGKFPNWFTVSVLASYANTHRYILQPGLGFICVSAGNVEELGRVSPCTLFDVSMKRDDI